MEGNQNEMRDALLKLRAEIGRFYNNEWIPYDAWQECDDVISHALSEPPRNCDVGTPEEQGERCLAQFDQWRRKGDGKKLITAIMAWAQTPYEAQEGGAE